MIKYCNKKFYRLKTSKNYLKFMKLLHKFFGEKFIKEIEIPSYMTIHFIELKSLIK